MNQGVKDLGILGQIYGTPGWVDDPVWIQYDWRPIDRRVGIRFHPPRKTSGDRQNWRSGTKNHSYITVRDVA